MERTDIGGRTAVNDEILDRAAGALVGSAAGDALGAGYEFTHPGPDSEIGMIGGGVFGWAPGQWTDDTSMAMAIALAADKSAGGIDLDEVAAGFMRWWDSQPPDVGVQTSKVLGAGPATARDMQAVAMSLPGLTGGNGSLMRTGPVALAFLDRPEECTRVAGTIGLLTHHDQQAIEACEMWSHAIRHAVVEAGFDGVREYAARCTAADYWMPLLDQAETGTPQDFPKNGWVVHALQTAWWAITTTEQSGPEHLPRALERCVRAGGDTDTTAAIAGALLGARWGASAVPAEWRRILHGYPGLTGDDLVVLAHRIVLKDAG
ncbi:ADP-ribosylglycohydrolase family protein [Nocardia cyriacigeorgica]|uniref:ADP-ribosylglycohydrolase family protein n=1 Tax=Nocardia cyriacigeorgica TaxID=135487 RepID=A0A6P1D255_9NOCA|nr:ADP-ribosylglycohydrolase family protein [Nocardia cyriacigeorgica]NEW44586.1 ADP-ribosylglycohydrolase family protein [Nocardia cyriacigeorgica]